MKKGKGRVESGSTAGQRQQPQAAKNAAAGWVLLACIGLGFLLYANSLGNEFVFDDLPLIIDNALIKDIGNIGKVIGWESGDPLYRPVRYVSYMLDYWLWGLKPAGYHVANILYHGIAGFILFLVLLELLGNRAAAVAGTVLFISHPVLTDSVTYISGRRDVLVGLFYLLSFYCFVRYRKEPRLWNAVLTGIFFLLALGSKEMGITLPAVCLAYDFTLSFTGQGRNAAGAVLGRVRQAAQDVVKKNWKLYLPLAVLAGIFFYSKIFLYYPSLKSSYYGGSAISNFATVVRIICYYIKLVLFPVVLHADYSYNAFDLSQSFLEWRVLGAGLVVAGAAGGDAVVTGAARAGIFRGHVVFYNARAGEPDISAPRADGRALFICAAGRGNDNGLAAAGVRAGEEAEGGAGAYHTDCSAVRAADDRAEPGLAGRDDAVERGGSGSAGKRARA